MSFVNDAVKMSGAIKLIGIAKLASTHVTIDIGGAVLSGGGTFVLGGTADVVGGLSTTTTLTNVNDTILGAGLLGDGGVTLVNDAGGSIIGNSATLTIDTGSATITNAGAIESTGTGQVVIKSALANSGLLYAAAGTLTVDGTVTGAGSAQIKTGLLDIAGRFAETVTFVAGATRTLKLTDWANFAGTIKGFSLTGANAIDLAGFALSGAHTSYPGSTTSGTLTVSNATQTSTIHLVGNYTASTFIVASDGHGGTTVTDPPANGSAFASALASFAPTPAASPPHDLRTPNLHAETMIARLSGHNA